MNAQERGARPVHLKVCTSNATHALLDALAREYESATGHQVSVICDSSKVMVARIESGEAADAAVLGAEIIEALGQKGRIAAGSSRLFARSRIGIAVRAGTRKPDIGSIAAFTQALIGAESIAHTVHGASGRYFPDLIVRLGIAQQVAGKTVTRPGGLIGKVVASGEAELAFQQISELLAVPGIALVGPIPEAVQKVIESGSGIFAASTQPAAAAAMLAFFSAPERAQTFAVKGLEPIRQEFVGLGSDKLLI